MIAVYIIFGVLVLLAALYIFLIFPSLSKNADKEKLKGIYVAHRGLHDETLPENSLPAFRVAISGGHAIEIDIHITADGEVVVFHDDTTKRMCGVDKRIEEMTLKEIKELRLSDTDCTIPTFEECLNTVKGQSPLLIEFKTMSVETANKLCEKANEILSNYEGEYFVQSFFPFVLSWYRKNRPDVLRGQLSTAFKGEELYKKAVANLLTNVIARPHFISYEHKYPKGISLKLNKLFGAVLICWTIKNEKQLIKAKENFSGFIFEDFIP